jgi:hypothetical protein
MKNNLLSLTTLVVTILTITIVGSAQQNLGGGRLSGTWDAAVTIDNCDTGANIASFQSTANFHAGGTFTGITSGTPPANRTPEVGIWRHENGDTYKFRFKAYLFSPAGTPVAYQIITHTLVLGTDNQTYVSNGDAKIYAMNGVQTAALCSTGTGRRMNFD